MVPFEIREVVCPTLCLFIYGANGTGKTQLAWTLNGKKLFIDSAGNPETLLKLGDKPNWDVIDAPRSWSQWPLFLKDPILDRYPILILDCLTGVVRDLLLDVIKNYPSKRVSPEYPGIQDYGLAAERIKVICSSLRDKRAKQHIIVIAHETIKQDKEDRIVGLPSVPGQTPAHILSLFGEQIYLTKDRDGIRTAYFSQKGLFSAATRLLDADKPVQNPNLQKIYEKYLTSVMLGITPS